MREPSWGTEPETGKQIKEPAAHHRASALLYINFEGYPMKKAVLFLVLFSCSLCYAQIGLPHPYGPLKHIPLTDPVLNTLPDFVGPPEDLVELPVGKQHLLVGGTGQMMKGLNLFFYLKQGKGKYLKLFEKTYEVGVIPHYVAPGWDWISAVKLSKDRTIQLVVSFPKSAWTRGEFFFSYDPLNKKIEDVGSPDLRVSFLDNGDGSYEILAGQPINNWDESGVDFQEIYNVQKDKFIDVKAKYPNYFRKLIKKYNKDIQKIEDDKQKPHPDRWDESYSNNETEIKNCILRAYINGGFKADAKKYGRELCRELEEKIKSEKENNQNSYFTGLDLKAIKSYLKAAHIDLE